MNCIECSSLMMRGPVTLKGTYRSKDLAVTMDDGWSCPTCGYATIHGRHSEEFSKRLKDEYRRATGQLEAEELRVRRKALGLTQERFAELFDVGIASLKRWESGEIPERASDQLLRIKLDPQYGETVLQESFLKLSSLCGMLKELPVARFETQAFETTMAGWNDVTFSMVQVDTQLVLNLPGWESGSPTNDSAAPSEDSVAAASVGLELAA